MMCAGIFALCLRRRKRRKEDKRRRPSTHQSTIPRRTSFLFPNPVPHHWHSPNQQGFASTTNSTNNLYHEPFREAFPPNVSSHTGVLHESHRNRFFQILEN